MSRPFRPFEDSERREGEWRVLAQSVNSSTDRAAAFRDAQLSRALTLHLESRLGKRTGKFGCRSWKCVRQNSSAAPFLLLIFSGVKDGAERTLDEILNRYGLSATIRNVIRVWKLSISEWPQTWRVPAARYVGIGP